MSETEKRLRIYMENRPALVDYAAPIVGSRSTAEDAVQEAYFRFVPPPGPPADIGSPASYLFRIVRNIAIDMTRRVSSEARRDAQLAQVTDGAARTPSPEEETVHREALALVKAALDELPAETRRAFEMKRLDGQTYEDIAAQLGTSKSSAHRLVQNALTHIMRRLGKKGR